MKSWKIESSEEVFSAGGRFSVHKQCVELPAGQKIDDYYFINGFNFAIIYAVTQDGFVILEKAYRHGPGKIVWSLPAGHLSPDEAPLDTAKRELLEECGYSGGTWTEIGSFVNNGNQQAGFAHMFLAEGVIKTAEPESGDLEEMEICLLKPEELHKILFDGQIPIISSAALIALANLKLQQ